MCTPVKPRRVWPKIWWMWVAYWVFLFIIMHVPGTSFVEIKVRNSDKGVHFLCYFLLVWLGGRYQLNAQACLSKTRLFFWFLIYAAYAGLDEWTQQFVGRHSSMTDWVFDFCGILTATILLSLRPEWAKLSVPDL